MRNSFLVSLVALASCVLETGAQNALSVLEEFVVSDPKPFVIVEGSGKETKNRGQGVVISSQGHVLSAGHIAWIDEDKSFTDKFRISFRGTGEGLPSGVAHMHKAVFNDREDAPFFEHYYHADLRRQGGSRFIGEGDLAVFQIKAEGGFPKVAFFSEDKPTVTAGDTLHLCHYNFPHKAGNPLFLINPVEVVGVAHTTSGIQYLAKGYYRVGSSGGAILKNGRLIGIQSAAYNINAKEIGEIPVGLISFQLVWGGLVEGLLTPLADDAAPEEEAVSEK